MANDCKQPLALHTPDIFVPGPPATGQVSNTPSERHRCVNIRLRRESLSFSRSTNRRHPSLSGGNHIKKNTLERRLYYKIFFTVCVCYATKNSYIKTGQAVCFSQNKIHRWFIYLGNVSGILLPCVLPMYYFSIKSSAELLTPTHPQLMVCAPTLGFNYGSKSPLPDRAGELHWRSVLCASVISFPLGAVARLVSQAAGQLRTRHRSLSSPRLTPCEAQRCVLNAAY